MILVRELFQLKYGQGDALPQLFGEARQTFLRDISAMSLTLDRRPYRRRVLIAATGR